MTQKKPPERTAYLVAEVAQMLGVSTRLVNDEVRTGRMHAARVGSRIIIPRPVIEARLDTHRAM